MRITPFLLAVSVSIAFAAPSLAEPSAAEIATAHELFDEALKLEEKGNWEGALERIRKVAAVKTTPQVRFHLALCLEKVGKLVDALVQFERAKSEAASDSSAHIVAANAQKHITELKERIPHVVVKVPSGVSGVAISIDGTPVVAALSGTEIPIDPGFHHVVVTATGKKDFVQDVSLFERTKPTTIDVVFEGEVAPPPKEIPPPPKEPPVDKPEQPESSGPGALPFIVGGIGLAALAGGGIFYGLRQSTISDLDGACGADRSQCPEDKRSTYDRGKTYTTVGNVLLGVGAVGVVTSIVLFVVAPSGPKHEKPASAAVTFVGGPGNVGFALAGRF